MIRIQKIAVLSALATKLKEKDSWCGETHFQKATYFLQELLCVQLDFEYILYKRGPFSFELRDLLTEMRAYNLLELIPNEYPYGPSLFPTELCTKIQKRFSETLGEYSKKIEFVADKFGNKGVTELEKLATALFVTKELADEKSFEIRSNLLHELKPHISSAEALSAIESVDKIIQVSQSL